MVVRELIVECLSEKKAEGAQIGVPTALLGEPDELDLTRLAEPPIESDGEIVDTGIDRLEP